MKLINAMQIKSLRSALKPVTIGINDANTYVVGRILGRDLHDLTEITHDEWVVLRNRAYPRAFADDWVVSNEFRRECAQYYEEYQENILGQKRLF